MEWELSCALSYLVAEPVLAIDPMIFRYCQAIEVIRSPEEKAQALGAWKPKHSYTFTLIKNNGKTYVYSHSNRTLYHSNVQVKIHDKCPEPCGFIGHLFLENDQPRFLMFDIMLPNGTVGESVEARYAKLREYSKFLPVDLCSIQWVGNVSCITLDFLSKLPHQVEYVFSMKPENNLAIAVHALSLE